MSGVTKDTPVLGVHTEQSNSEEKPNIWTFLERPFSGLQYDGGRSSVNRESEIKSEDTGFDPPG